jgi:hypothetical protein
MIFKELFFAFFCSKSEEEGDWRRWQYYSEISIPQDRKKPRKIGYGKPDMEKVSYPCGEPL